MDDLLARQVLRQLRIINTFLIVFAVSLLVFFTIAGVLVYRAVQEIHDAKRSADNLQSKLQSRLDLKSELCNTETSADKLFKQQTEICK